MATEVPPDRLANSQQRMSMWSSGTARSMPQKTNQSRYSAAATPPPPPAPAQGHWLPADHHQRRQTTLAPWRLSKDLAFEHGFMPLSAGSVLNG